MVQTVKIRKGEKVIRIHFMWNPDLVEIMQSHKGWWFRKEKCWQFPLWKLEPIYDELTSKHYNVEITKLIEQPKRQEQQYQRKLNIDYWKEKEVFSVYGKCKKCGLDGFINKDGLCNRCNYG